MGKGQRNTLHMPQSALLRDGLQGRALDWKIRHRRKLGFEAKVPKCQLGHYPSWMRRNTSAKG